MEILYKAFDGELFDNADECLRHERENPLFKMCGKNGTTTKPNDALVVEILNEYNGAKAFIELCESCGDTFYDGIDEFTGKGIYVWDGYKYVYVSGDTLKALRHIMN